MSNKIIDSSDPGIVARETKIQLSDEKLKAIMCRTYERAQKDSEKICLHKFYDVFLSVASTLFLTLLTSSFNNIGKVSSEIVTTTVWIIFIIMLILGFILMSIHVSHKTQTHTNERDIAVDEIFNTNFIEN